MKTMSEYTKTEPLYIVSISVHGLIRGCELELGGDADTGGLPLVATENGGPARCGVVKLSSASPSFTVIC
jgi:hypothetical protein